ncbi:MAG: hypothetical protein C0504_08865 [Candidatus Solibacter sp.]|nr:hypothetical protein [Candidatus Solibacter sp.]
MERLPAVRATSPGRPVVGVHIRHTESKANGVDAPADLYLLAGCAHLILDKGQSPALPACCPAWLRIVSTT